MIVLGDLLAFKRSNFYCALPLPKFPPKSITSCFLAVDSDLPAFLLGTPCWFFKALFSLPLCLWLVPMCWVVVTWFQAVGLSADPHPPLSFPMILISQPPYVQTPDLTTKHRTHSERQEAILSSPSPAQSFEHRLSLGPEVDFRSPMSNLSIPQTCWLRGHFTSRLSSVCQRQCLSISISKGLFSDSWLILTSDLAESRS